MRFLPNRNGNKQRSITDGRGNLAVCPVLSPLSVCGELRKQAAKNAPPSEKVVHCIELGIVCHKSRTLGDVLLLPSKQTEAGFEHMTATSCDASERLLESFYQKTAFFCFLKKIVKYCGLKTRGSGFASIDLIRFRKAAFATITAIISLMIAAATIVPDTIEASEGAIPFSADTAIPVNTSETPE